VREERRGEVGKRGGGEARFLIRVQPPDPNPN